MAPAVMEKSRAEEIAEIESQLAGLTPAEALKKASEIAAIKPVADAAVKDAALPDAAAAKDAPAAAKDAGPVLEQKLAQLEEAKAAAERRTQEVEGYNRNLASEHEKFKQELARARKEMLAKTRPDALERIDGLEDAVKHVIETREIESTTEQAKPAEDDGMAAFRMVLVHAHPDAPEYLARPDVIKRMVPFFEEHGNDWKERPLDLVREVSKLKVEDASKGSEVYKQEVETLKVKLAELESKQSKSTELSAMSAPAGGRSAPVVTSSGDDDFVKKIQNMTPAQFRAYTDGIAKGS